MYTVKNKASAGFTLLEILIAMFIFTIVSMILASTLHNIIGTQSSTERNAKRLRETQLALLMISRDIEQAVNRPILSAAGKEEAAFIGTAREFTFTHTGLSNPTGVLRRSSLQRVSYARYGSGIWRMAWPVLDQAPETTAHKRELLQNVTEAHFQYLDQSGKSHNEWPVAGNQKNPLPRAVRVYLTIAKWGSMSQLYVVS